MRQPVTKRLLRGWLTRQPIEDLPELRSILTVQKLVAKIPKQPKPYCLNKDDALGQWSKAYKCKNSMHSKSKLDKTAFNKFFEEASAHLQQQEEQAFLGYGKIGPMKDEELDGHIGDAFLEALKVKFSRHMCLQAAVTFELLDKDNDGTIFFDEAENLLLVAAHGNGREWLKNQFYLYSADKSDAVNETESQLILNSIVTTQKAVISEIFVNHVLNMPKKTEKLVAKSLLEEDFNSKILEMVRCVFHFAQKLDVDRTLYSWEQFEDSQQKEFPELQNLLAVYSKGFYDERFTLYKRKQEKQIKLGKGLLLAVTIGFCDYIAAII